MIKRKLPNRWSNALPVGGGVRGAGEGWGRRAKVRGRGRGFALTGLEIWLSTEFGAAMGPVTVKALGGGRWGRGMAKDRILGYGQEMGLQLGANIRQRDRVGRMFHN